MHFSHRRDATLSRKASIITVFLTHHGSIVAACCPQSGALSSFTVLMLFVGRQAQKACEKYGHDNPQKFTFEDQQHSTIMHTQNSVQNWQPRAEYDTNLKQGMRHGCQDRAGSQNDKNT